MQTANGVKRRRRDYLQSIWSLVIALISLTSLVDSFSTGTRISGKISSNANGGPSRFISSATKTKQSIHKWRTKSALFSNSNAGGNNILNGGKTLTSNQIIYPEIYLSNLKAPPIEENPIPLFVAMLSLKKSLKKIITASSAYNNNQDMTDEQSTLLESLDTTTILRIEESISTVRSVDPLCWLHAQQSSIRNLRRKLSRGNVPLPVIYFGDAEGQVEAAAIGKVSNSYSDSWDPFVGKRIWDDENENENDGQQKHSMFKESDLPKGARVYGGSRFDWKFYQDKMTNRNKFASDDWDGFGGDRGGYWILPAVELRREIIADEPTIVNGDSTDGTGSNKDGGRRKLTLAIHLHNDAQSNQKHARLYGHRSGWNDAATRTLTILEELTDRLSPAVPCTTLPPVITRSESTGNGGESINGDVDTGYVFERGVTEALKLITNPDTESLESDTSLRKVVLARKVDLNLGASVSGLDVLMKLKFGGHIGHIFYMNPGEDELESSSNIDGMICSREFLGCTPERLFRVKEQGSARTVTSEALAGTRIRGLTPAADAELLHELLSSKKDMLENEITGNFISKALQGLENNGWLEKNRDNNLLKTYEFNGIANDMKLDGGAAQRRFFVRRLRHLQHICQTFEGQLSDKANVIDVSRSLLSSLHPTPAVCGDSPDASLDFIRTFETLASYDRGYFAGPFGYIGHDSTDIIVAIRSGLVTNYHPRSNLLLSNDESLKDTTAKSKISVFAGAGIVEGSTVQGEWTETSHKLGVMSSLFPSSPITLQSYSSPNVAWSSSFIEELLRCGVTTFYICPGSRNTPLTTAIFKAMRSNVGVVRAISVHDERGAGFRALGYARQNGRPAAVVTSSGTAVANLYPSVVEASSDGVPLLLLTADRPYESRDTGSNQSIDQVKIFSSSYVRWYRDVPAPSDDVPVSLALSDANHAVSLTKQLLGPVHLNIQFRENLAPDDGPIRNDARVGSVTKFHSARFTDVPGFTRWSLSGRQWQDTHASGSTIDSSVMEVVELIIKSKRGIIVAGNLRRLDDADDLSSTISCFAKIIGFPILGGVQSGPLRRELPVIPYAEHVLKHPLVSKGLQPDLILQLGSPLISTEIPSMIVDTVKRNPSTHHVLVQQLYSYERADPEQTVTHRISTKISHFLNKVMQHIDGLEMGQNNFGSELAPLMHLGKELRVKMPRMIHESSPGANLDSFETSTVIGQNGVEGSLTEPQIVQAVAEVLSESKSPAMSLFLSNSMPVRDGEFFLYPPKVHSTSFPTSISVNRGASGIDGIISTAIGCADLFRPTTLVCGDVTTLHDLNALYGLTSDHTQQSNPSSLNRIPLTTVVVNNGGGAIFSFLPIAKHGQDVGFDELWGTPTNQFSFEKGASAFGLPYKSASSFESFKEAYRSSIVSGAPTIIEAKVTNRSANVGVHQKITQGAIDVIERIVGDDGSNDIAKSHRMKLPVQRYSSELLQVRKTRRKTLLLLHGWMGDKTDWDPIATALIADLSDEWDIIAIDLPGHGDAPFVLSTDRQVTRSLLRLDNTDRSAHDSKFTLNNMAHTVCRSLIKDHGIVSLHAIAGYSLGGRIALAMKRICSEVSSADDSPMTNLVSDQTQLLLLGADPKLPSDNTESVDGGKHRAKKDFSIARSLELSSFRSYLIPEKQDRLNLRLFLTKWYSPPIWGDLRNRQPAKYDAMIQKRVTSLSRRRHDIAAVLRGCSPPQTAQEDWKVVVPSKTWFVAGSMDVKYSSIGRRWRERLGISKYIEIPNAGHALLVEDSSRVARILSDFINADEQPIDEGATLGSLTTEPTSTIPKGMEKSNVMSKHNISAMEYESFVITMSSADGSDKGVLGVGWGKSARTENELKKREGCIISLTASDGADGVGEVSPLKGLHKETLEDAEMQLRQIKNSFTRNGIDTSSFCSERILSLDGSLTEYIDKIFFLSGIDRDMAAPSVRSGLEMAVLSVASQISGFPLPHALARHYYGAASLSSESLPINGLVTRGSESQQSGEIVFPSIKVKVGDMNVLADAQQLIKVKALSPSQKSKLRADANRSWTLESAQAFVSELQNLDPSALSIIEFIEEPLEKLAAGVWNFEAQVDSLEQFTCESSVLYALDESLVDLAEAHHYNYEQIASELRETFGRQRRGCAAFVLKPAMLGIELSMRIAKLAQQEFGISAVFSSSFDSGIGLSYTSILAAVADKSPYATELTKYSHGLGTFTMLVGDTLSPPFKSYVSKDGLLNVASLSKSLYGLSLDSISDRLPMSDCFSVSEPTIASSKSESYQAVTSSSTGRDITVAVSMPLPFSDRIASSRFTDLPQMSRWCPWLNSVTYLDAAGLTEWNLNIKGVKFSWKAQSEMLNNPAGIKWNSVSGLRNSGIVEFEPVSSDSCTMKLKMSIIMPYIMVSLFQGMPSIVHDFLQNKLLKWSLEMFRDVVKADLALERGDNELGDALFGAVEGRANALEEALRR